MRILVWVLLGIFALGLAVVGWGPKVGHTTPTTPTTPTASPTDTPFVHTLIKAQVDDATRRAKEREEALQLQLTSMDKDLDAAVDKLGKLCVWYLQHEKALQDHFDRLEVLDKVRHRHQKTIDLINDTTGKQLRIIEELVDRVSRIEEERDQEKKK